MHLGHSAANPGAGLSPARCPIIISAPIPAPRQPLGVFPPAHHPFTRSAQCAALPPRADGSQSGNLLPDDQHAPWLLRLPALIAASAALLNACCTTMPVHASTELGTRQEVVLDNAQLDAHMRAFARATAAPLVSNTAAGASIFALPPVDIDIDFFGKQDPSFDPVAAKTLLQEVWEVVDTNYLDARGSGFDRERWRALRDEMMGREYTNMRGVHRAVREMLYRGVGDTYSRFLSPRELDTMRKYDITGVGLNLGTAEECRRRTSLKLPGSTGVDGEPGVWVLGLLRGGAADVAGIKQGDKLLEVDGVRIDRQSPFQVASLIRGSEQNQQASTSGAREAPIPSTVKVKVQDVDTNRIRQVVVARATIDLPSPVEYRMENKNGIPVGYIKLTSFNARAQPDVAAALDALRAKGAQAFVLDLRDNRGGLVNQGVEVAKLFLDSDAIIVQQLGARASSYQRVTTTPASTNPKGGGSSTGPPTGPTSSGAAKASTVSSIGPTGNAPTGNSPMSAPLTVLVNESTASASEILAGALHDNCRAILVGKRTFGKGLIQSVYELSDSSGLVLTVGKYVTPNGTDIDREGIQPDFGRAPGPLDASRVLDACRVVRQEHGL